MRRALERLALLENQHLEARKNTYIMMDMLRALIHQCFEMMTAGAQQRATGAEEEKETEEEPKRK